MVEKAYRMTVSDEKVIEKVLLDENIHYLHMILGNGEGLPEHYTNATVYMTVVRGRLSIRLDEQEAHGYEAGTLLKIPFNTKMNVKNNYPQTLELIVVKAPAPVN